MLHSQIRRDLTSMYLPRQHTNCSLGSGCDSVASDTRGPQFESSQRQKIYIEHLFTVNCIAQDENNEKDRE